MDPAQRANVEILNELEARPFNGAGGVILPFGASTVVWRPGGVSSGNVYATWAEVVAAVAALNGDITIGVDTSLAAAIIPAGAWDLRPAGISGPVTIVNATENAAFGAFFSTAAAAVSVHGLTGLDSVLFENLSTVDFITSTATDQVIFTLRAAEVFQDTAAATAFFKVTGGFGVLIMDDGSFVSTLGAGTHALQSVAPGFLSLQINDISVFGPNQLLAAGATAGVLVGGVSQTNFNIAYATQPGAPAVFPYGFRQKNSAAIAPGTGKTAAISAFINANTVILVSLNTPVGDALTIKYAALGADRSAGFPGTFQISALAAAGGGAVNGADTSTIDWEVIN